MMRRRWDYFVKWLMGVEPPKEYQMQSPSAQPPPPPPREPTKADILRGAYGPYRANNDLLFYHLDIRVDPEKKFIGGKNTIRFKMLKDDTRIQLDLHGRARRRQDPARHDGAEVRARVGRGVRGLPGDAARAGSVYSIDFYYSGNPKETGRFGGIAFRKDPAGRTGSTPRARASAPASGGRTRTSGRTKSRACDISVAIPNGLVDVSNGKFLGKTDLGDGYTRWDWLVQYPINNYSVSLNIGNVRALHRHG